MSRLVETIKCKDGRLMNLRHHEARLNRSRRELFGLMDNIKLNEIIFVPSECQSGLFRCRVIYSEGIEQIEFHPHKYRTVASLQLIECDEINYPYKFTDRNLLEELFKNRGNCDDILIVKNGVITDSYTANVVFFDGHTWWTPDTPLLPGTQRARLLAENKIRACRISPGDMCKYLLTGLINAMQDLNDMPVMPVSRIERATP